MNLDDLGAQFQAHKGPILAAGAAGVAGLAYYRKKKTTAAAAAGAGTAAGTSSVSAGGQTATMAGMGGAAPYDSSSSDVYGLMQPQLESLGGQLSDLQNRMNSVPVSTAPGTATTAPAPVGSTVNGGGSATSSPVPVAAPTSTPKLAYYTQQINGAGGAAAYTPTPGGAYTGRVDSTSIPTTQQTYTPVATGVGQQGLMSQQALPQTGSLGPVGTIYTDGGQRKQVTGYTFNGMPNVSWLYN